jgi:glutamine synthetase
MIRIPEGGRSELRLADGSANPYLLQTGLLAAGLDGIMNKHDPGKRLDINMYTHGHKVRREEAAAEPARCAAGVGKVDGAG